jgi:hypothetical protein
LLDRRSELIVRHHFRNQTDTLGLLGGKISAGELNVKSFFEWNAAMEQRRRGDGTVTATNDFGHAELSRFGGNAEVVTIGQRQPAAEAPAAHRGDSDLRHVAQQPDDLIGGTGLIPGSFALPIFTQVVEIQA